ncbi:MAG: nucleoside triphosphate pyrophosphohydrolase [Deltaproteobacteria bacterium RBG_16_54_11]|jgi:tetrapyrrole methylase family protein/MazG family protein|nr:MAG: nucleoside triphosphate pyrophosphohydrolase [Deltaproteobacteria bacterium RBG_16_54_11]
MDQKGFSDLVAIMARLRGEDGCPWDRRQTKEDLKPFLIEETYEILEALDRGDDQGLQEELGDLLFHIIFMARIAEEEGAFDIADVTHGVAEKMVRRHPHVFGSSEVSGPREVEANWAKLKAAEKPRGSLMEGLPLHLPALMRAFRLTQRASEVGFDWEHKDQVWAKLEEELKEFQEALREERKDALREELGDILFTLVNLARFIGVDPEDALRRVTNKFAERFIYIERRLREQGKAPHESSLAEMDALWEESKKKGNNG